MRLKKSHVYRSNLVPEILVFGETREEEKTLWWQVVNCADPIKGSGSDPWLLISLNRDRPNVCGIIRDLKQTRTMTVR